MSYINLHTGASALSVKTQRLLIVDWLLAVGCGEAIYYYCKKFLSTHDEQSKGMIVLYSYNRHLLIILCLMTFQAQHGFSFIFSSRSSSLHSVFVKQCIGHTFSTHTKIPLSPFISMSNTNHKKRPSESTYDPHRATHDDRNVDKRHHNDSSITTQLQQSTMMTEQFIDNDDDCGVEPTTNTETTTTAINSTNILINNPSPSSSLYRAEGLLAVYKPLNWTSQDVVAYIKGIITRDAKDRGIDIPKSKKSRGRIKVGHGGTLDPLAEGVLVIGIGNGTKALDSFLSGTKSYQAMAKLGFQTTTLDMEGDITHEEPYHHATAQSIQAILSRFLGKIQQVPPIFSAIRKNGKKLYEEAREGKTAEDLAIESREVEIMSLHLLTENHKGESLSLPDFGLDVECGGGTYIRSLVRDIGIALETRATMTHLIRTKQGPFTIDDALKKEEWTPARIALWTRSVP